MNFVKHFRKFFLTFLKLSRLMQKKISSKVELVSSHQNQFLFFNIQPSVHYTTYFALTGELFNLHFPTGLHIKS